MPNAIWIWRAAASRARRGLGLAPEIQSAADGGALQIIISLQPFLIDSPDSNKCMLEFLRSNWSDILWHVAQHLWLVFISIAIAMVIALPLGILITRRKRLRAPVLGIPNVMQTIPSLALFRFLLPLPFFGGPGPRPPVVAPLFSSRLPDSRSPGP